MNTATVPNRDKEIARQRVNQFVRRFEESYRLLAYHAALPLVLTPELLNYLRNQFLRGQVPWLAEVDLLLSDLCTPVGYELYAMDTAVRAYLLEEMHNDAALSSQRMQEVARLLLGYVRHLAQTNPFISKQELEAQQWAAMVYLDDQRENAVRQIVQAFQESRAIGGSRWQTEMARLSRITQEFAPQLRAYPNLLEYAELITRFVTEPESVNPEPGKHSYSVLGETLDVSEEWVAQGRGSFPLLQVFKFEVVTVDKQGNIIDYSQQQAQYFREDLGNGVFLDMVAIPGGSFLMGSPDTEEGRSDDESPQHPVTVQPFFMGKYPVTQAQWQAVANLPQVNQELDPDPSNFKGSDRPVEQVSWYDCVEFCARLSQYTGRDYRLPSEAEWEYACRAGSTTPFHFGETITTDLANYNGNYTYGEGHKNEYRDKDEYREQTTPVGSFQVASAFGLFDMHGNVSEWCLDHWHDSYEGAPSDGQAWLLDNNRNENHSLRLLRGGSWDNNPGSCRCGYRYWYQPDDRYNGFGCRVVCGAAWSF